MLFDGIDKLQTSFFILLHMMQITHPIDIDRDNMFSKIDPTHSMEYL